MKGSRNAGTTFFHPGDFLIRKEKEPIRVGSYGSSRLANEPRADGADS